MQLWGNVSCTMPVIIILAYLEQAHILLFLEDIPRMCRIYSISQWSLVQLRSYPLHVVQLMVKLRQTSVPFLWINGTWHEKQEKCYMKYRFVQGLSSFRKFICIFSAGMALSICRLPKRNVLWPEALKTQTYHFNYIFLLWYFTTFYCLISVTKRKKKKVDIYQKHQYFIFYPHATNGSPFLLFACFFPWSAFQIQIHVILWIYQILS